MNSDWNSDGHTHRSDTAPHWAPSSDLDTQHRTALWITRNTTQHYATTSTLTPHTDTTPSHPHTHTHTHTRKQTHTHVHTQTQTHTHTHTHTHVCSVPLETTRITTITCERGTTTQ